VKNPIIFPENGL